MSEIREVRTAERWILGAVLVLVGSAPFAVTFALGDHPAGWEYIVLLVFGVLAAAVIDLPVVDRFLQLLAPVIAAVRRSGSGP